MRLYNTSGEVYFELSGNYPVGLQKLHCTMYYRTSEVCGKTRVHSVDRSPPQPTAIRRCTQTVYNSVYVGCTRNHCSDLRRPWSKLADRRLWRQRQDHDETDLKPTPVLSRYRGTDGKRLRSYRVQRYPPLYAKHVQNVNTHCIVYSTKTKLFIFQCMHQNCTCHHQCTCVEIEEIQ